jgi:hypothetical protein
MVLALPSAHIVDGCRMLLSGRAGATSLKLF